MINGAHPWIIQIVNRVINVGSQMNVLNLLVQHSFKNHEVLMISLSIVVKIMKPTTIPSNLLQYPRRLKGQYMGAGDSKPTTTVHARVI